MKWIKACLLMLAMGLTLSAHAAALTEDQEAEYREAIIAGDVKIVDKYLKADPSLKEMKFFGWTPIQMASNTNQIPLVKYLIEKGADVNYVQPNAHHSAFQLAAINRFKELTSVLAKGGANVNEKLKGDVSLIRYFRDEGDKEMEAHMVSLGVKDDGCEEKCF